DATMPLLSKIMTRPLAVRPTRGMGGGLFHGEILGLQCYVGFVHGDEFRERPDPVLVWPCIHHVARFEALDLWPDTDHDPGHVVAQDHRQAIGQDELELTIPDLRLGYDNGR